MGGMRNGCKTEQYKERMKKSVENLKDEFAQYVPEGRPSFVDKIRVDYYGQLSPLQAVANITVPEARILQIQPWGAG